MILRTRLPLIALLASLPAPAQAQSASDFSLEPAPTPTSSPQAQGPADTRAGIEIRPRAVNTPTPSPRPTPTTDAVQPTPTSTPLAQPTPLATAGTPAASNGRTRPAPPPTPAPRSRPSPIERPPLEPSEPSVSGAIGTPAPPEADSVATPVPATQTAEDDGGAPEWAWFGGLAALATLLGAGFVAWRRQRRDPAVPEIQRPVVAKDPIPGPPAGAGEALMLRVDNEKLIRSAAFATLKYRLTLVNRTDSALQDLAVGVDLVSAHARAPMEQQLATEGTPIETRHRIERLAPRQSMTFEGQVQLPLGQVHVVMQGRHPLLVPLMRVRVDGGGKNALLRTFVVGQGEPGGGRVQPFPLDEPPRSYAPIAQRELA